MIACLDVDYRHTEACAAAVVFPDWGAAEIICEKVVRVTDVQPYRPGEFFRRELPCLLAVLQTLPPISTILIDGYVWLDKASAAGLGAYLYKALDQQVPVIGVAKTKFRDSDFACEVTRGGSKKPLYVTAVGIDVQVAKDCIRRMRGPYRIPTLISRADYVSRRGWESMCQTHYNGQAGQMLS